ncbi:MAG: hypothetical protein H0U73_06070 [Tatlockia sp.]|nr:hypothetical protein [Tatlockia sp.]
MSQRVNTARPYNKHASGNHHIEKQINRIQNLKDLLIDLPEFQEFVLSNPDSIALICEEFKEYNQSLKTEIEQTMWVDIDKIKEDYNQLFDQIKKNVKSKSLSDNELMTPIPIPQMIKQQENLDTDFHNKDINPNNLFAKNIREKTSEDSTNDLAHDLTDFVTMSNILLC